MSKLTITEARSLRVLIAQVKALILTIEDILGNTNVNEARKYISYREMANTYNDMVEQARVLLKGPVLFYTFNMNKMKSWEDTLWPSQKVIMENTLLYSRMLLVGLEGALDFVDDEIENLSDFFQSHLRSVVYDVPEKEKDVQNAVESLMIGRGMSRGADYDRESGKFEFSGKEYIPDFIIDKMSLCIEVKLLKAGRKSKMIEEISADITAYSKEYRHIIFIIYDLGVIQNELEFKRDIELQQGVKVIIVKH